MPKSKYLRSKERLIKNNKFIYKPSAEISDYIMKKPPPEPLFRGLNAKHKATPWNEDVFRLFVRNSIEKRNKNGSFVDERIISN